MGNNSSDVKLAAPLCYINILGDPQFFKMYVFRCDLNL